MSQSNQNQNHNENHNNLQDQQSQILEKETSNLTVDFLLKQNQIKQKALSKATDLIQLLKIQIEVQRNSKYEALSDLQIKLRSQYRKQIEHLKYKNQGLERQLKRRDQFQNQTVYNNLQNQSGQNYLQNSIRKTLNYNERPSKSKLDTGKTKMRRTNSSSDLRKSIQNKSNIMNVSHTYISKPNVFKMSIYNNKFKKNQDRLSRMSSTDKKKKITNLNQSSIQKNFIKNNDVTDYFSIQKQLIYEFVKDLQEKQIQLLNNLGSVIAQETEDFNYLAGKFQINAQQAKQTIKCRVKKSMLQQKYEESQKKVLKSGEIISAQQIAINKLRIYIQQIQQIVSEMTVRMRQIYNQNHSSSFKQFYMSQQSEKKSIFKDINHLSSNSDINYLDVTKNCLSISRDWKAKLSKLKQQNIELKNILDNMVQLVREQKKSRKKTQKVK